MPYASDRCSQLRRSIVPSRVAVVATSPCGQSSAGASAMVRLVTPWMNAELSRYVPGINRQLLPDPTSDTQAAIVSSGMLALQPVLVSVPMRLDT